MRVSHLAVRLFFYYEDVQLQLYEWVAATANFVDFTCLLVSSCAYYCTFVLFVLL